MRTLYNFVVKKRNPLKRHTQVFRLIEVKILQGNQVKVPTTTTQQR